MKDQLSLENLLQNLRSAPREPYDPDIDHEPPFNPEWAKAHNELQYVTDPRYREWLDRELGDLAACAKRWHEVAEAELQMRLPFPEVCPWMYAQETLDRYAALKQLVKENTK